METTEGAQKAAIKNDENQQHQPDQSYRDSIATVDKAGKRIWIYPKKPKGDLYRARTWFSYLLLAILFGIPFVKVGGQPLLLLNVIERKFIIFGLAFWPQDFHLFVLAMITLIIFIILFTAVFGRVWCGWACPQTVFMEMVFRKIEYLIEGDANKQRALNAAPWTGEKILKKGLKLTIFYAIAFLIGNTLLAYVVGVDRLAQLVTHPPAENIGLFMAVFFFSLVFFWVFAWFREQACVIVCPYGRFQSVLLDKSSIVVSYDFKRGEPRGKRSKKQEQNLGDCVDCKLCVAVCPTGIDIRNGTQLECINCTACIDACNGVMDKIKKPRGLIRYSSYTAIAEGAKKLITPRVIGYTVVLAILIVAQVFLFVHRSDVESTVLRTPGVLYQELDDGYVRNLYNIKVVNKTFAAMTLSIRLKDREGRIKMIGSDQLTLPSDGIAEAAFFIDLPREKLGSASNKITLEVLSGDKVLEELKTTFMAPRR